MELINFVEKYPAFENATVSVNLNESIDSFVERKFSPNSILLYKKGIIPNQNNFKKIIGYIELPTLLNDESTTIKYLQRLFRFFCLPDRNVLWRIYNYDSFLQTSIICITNSEGKISKLFVLKGKLLIDTGLFTPLNISKTNLNAATHQRAIRFFKNCLSFSIMDNIQSLNILDNKYNRDALQKTTSHQQYFLNKEKKNKLIKTKLIIEENGKEINTKFKTNSNNSCVFRISGFLFHKTVMKDTFDDFKFFNSIKSGLSEKRIKFESLKITIDDDGTSLTLPSNYETYLAFLSIYHFYSDFGWEFMKEKASTLIKSEKFKSLVLETIFACTHFEKYEISLFEDFLIDQKIYLQESLEDIFPNSPTNSRNIFRFIEEWRNEQKNDVFILLLSALISFFLQDLDSEKDEFHQQFFDEIVNRIKRNENFSNKNMVLNGLFNKLRIIYKNTNVRLADYLSIPQRVESNDLFHFHEDGLISIPWTCVFFLNDSILISHPNYPIGSTLDKRPLKCEMKNSKKAFNHIKPLFIKSLPEIAVECVKGEVKAVIDIACINDCIQILDQQLEKSVKYNITSTLKKKIKSRKANSSEIVKWIQSLKSEYLNYLVDTHINDYKITYSQEVRQNSNEINVDEDAFFFVLNENNNKLIVIFENTLSSRASIIFLIKKDLFEDSIAVIHNFFASLSINKREKIMAHLVDFDYEGIVKYDRIIHTDLTNWKNNIYQITKTHQCSSY